MPQISVIVPVYGVENYLPACVDSLLNQTFSDFELILVDDGSPDACPELCDRYAAQDPRVRVIHQENAGLSAARNSGICAAKGSAIAFVDSDDTVSPRYLELLYTALEESGADMALCGVEDVNEDGSSQQPPVFTQPVQAGVFDGKALMHQFFTPASTCYTVAWNKLYRAKLWQTLRYPEGMIHEDDAVAHRLFSACEKVACITEPLYFYRLRQGSICRTALRPGSFDGVSAHAAWCRFFAQNHEKELLDKALFGCWMRYLNLCAQCRCAPLTWPLAARWHTAQAEMCNLLPFLKNCSTLSLMQKLSCYRWAKKTLALPAKSDKRRVALLLPPGLPVPAVQGGAVETLAEHLIAQNQKEQQLELAIVCQWNADAAALSGRWPQTLFDYRSQPGRSLLHSLKFRLAALVGKPVHWNRWYGQPLAFLKRLDADLYIAEGGDLTGWQQASRVLGRERFAAHLHGDTEGSAALDALYSGALAISDHVADIWQQGRSDRPTAPVPNCVDTARFCPDAEPRNSQALRAKLGLAPDDFVILFCGRICPEKGVHRLVEALRLCADPSVKLVVIGSPFFAAQDSSPFFSQLKADAAALQQQGRICFTGFVPNNQLPDYYRMADCACFPALWDEPAGITAIEAMACGCPILATRSGGMPGYLAGSGAILLDRDEIIDADGSSRKVENAPALAPALADAILQLRADPQARAAMAQQGVQRAAAFSRSAYYQNFCSAVQRFAGLRN